VIAALCLTQQRRIARRFQVGTFCVKRLGESVYMASWTNMLTESWHNLLHLQEILWLFRLSFNRELAGTVVVRRVLLSSESSLALSVDDVPLPRYSKGVDTRFKPYGIRSEAVMGK
jgi:hypothetical protein